ncbi:MAG: hypothetical protein GQ527_01975, partial [Bacteroidales bacterium]|nr:hypothetical protein [Bacteroidales bacterium]
STNPTYSFSAQEGDECNRFLLHLMPKAFGLNEINKENGLVKIYAADHQVYISSSGLAVNEAGTIEIFNILGQKIDKRTIEASPFISFPVDIKASYIFVKVMKASGVSTQKVFIH